ncbi:MAG: glycosyltransferase family 4 protein [Pseudomonadales bacterium]|nr:glycosyltransferase family 4 protein [Pseudomonadales bacterium]
MDQNPLRILHTESSTGWGGQEIRILTEARGMIDRGHQVTLLTPEEAQIAPAADARGIPCIRLPITRKRLGPWWTLRHWLAQHTHDFDIINTHSSTDAWLVALACVTLDHPVPVVRTRHVSTAVRSSLPTRWLYTRATSHVVVTGEQLRHNLHTNTGINLDHMTSVRTGIDLARFKPTDNPSKARHNLGLLDRPTVGIVATLRDWKGHEDLLQAWATLPASLHDWQLIIVGDGPRRPHLEALIEELQLHDRIKMVGNVDDVPAWMQSMDIFALPSYANEGVPQGLMQAMACALPVISTPVGAIGEIVLDDQTGLMALPRNPESLGAALQRLMTQPDLRQRLAKAALQNAQASMGLDVMLDAMEQIFYRFRRPD